MMNEREEKKLVAAFLFFSVLSVNIERADVILFGHRERETT